MPQKLLSYVGPAHIIGGLLLFSSGFLPSVQAVIASLLNLPPGVAWSPFFVTVFGPTIASWGVLFTVLARLYLASPSPALWQAMVWSLAIWAPLDTALCLYYGVLRGAILNAFVVVVLAIILVLVRPIAYNQRQ